jgi:hypothetical protein
MFLAKTCLFGQSVNFKADTIEEIAEWATFHNLQYIKTDREIGHGLETFTVYTHDASPLGEHAIQRLSRVRFVCYRPDNPLYPTMGVGDGFKAGRLKKKMAFAKHKPERS